MGSDNPHVSIGIPVYNGEKYLKIAIDSVLAQTYTDFELIISDNASTDSTQQICQEYAARDSRIRYCRSEENLGAAKNFRRVFELARGKYFKWVAHDDACAPTFLERCVEALDRDDSLVIAYSHFDIIDESGQFLKHRPAGLHLESPKPEERFKQFYEALRFNEVKYSPFYVVFGLIRADSLRQTSVQGSFVSADTILLAELSLLGRFYEVPEHLLLIREHAQNSYSTASAEFATLLSWYDSSKQGKFVFPYWRQWIEFFKAINHTPIGWWSRLHCYGELGGWSYLKRRVLFKELVINLARFLNLKSIGILGWKEVPKQWG
jgi:glycosyltransferase involved in cell wall biosynthesis